MALTPEQVKELKGQLTEQIKNLPEEQRTQAQKQIDEMSSEALESMVKQQQAQQSGQTQQPQKGIFRMIVDGDVPSKKIDENKDAVAVVSVRPVSKGHVLIIPKKPAGDANSIPSQALILAKKVAKKISSKLKTSSTEIQTQSLFGEAVVNVIPVYDKPVNVNSSSYEAKEEELEEIYKLLRVVKRKKIEKIRIRKKQSARVKPLILKRRIP